MRINIFGAVLLVTTTPLVWTVCALHSDAYDSEFRTEFDSITAELSDYMQDFDFDAAVPFEAEVLDSRGFIRWTLWFEYLEIKVPREQPVSIVNFSEEFFPPWKKFADIKTWVVKNINKKRPEIRGAVIWADLKFSCNDLKCDDQATVHALATSKTHIKVIINRQEDRRGSFGSDASTLIGA